MISPDLTLRFPFFLAKQKTFQFLDRYSTCRKENLDVTCALEAAHSGLSMRGGKNILFGATVEKS